jgi:AcrR family transcriptional regulator
MSTAETSSPAQRMPADERRALVLDAATRAFSRGGYAGTSTDAVAREAGVSQPYVVRIFGTKLELFLEVFDRACDRIRLAFEGVLADGPFDPEDDDDWDRLGLAYTQLLADRDLLMVMMHGFAASGVDEIAARSRAGMGRIFATILGTGCTAELARDFVAKGMLLNVMLSMRAHEHLDQSSDLATLTTCAFGEALPLLASDGALESA